MKKLTIGALVGGILLFIWQFLSYGVLDLHYSQMSYTPAQEEIMECLENANLEEGEYYMIRAPKGNEEIQEELLEERMGEPWAMIQYHNELKYNFGLNVSRALVINIVAIFILAWILSQFAEITMKNACLTSLGVGLIIYFTSPYLDTIWFSTNSLPDLLDAILPWTLIGAWLGWWMNK